MSEKALRSLRVLAAEQRAGIENGKKQVEDLQEKIHDLKCKIGLYDESRELLLKAAEISREKTIGHIEKVVTSALRAVFQDKTMALKVNVRSTLRSGLEADYVVQWSEDGQIVEGDPLEAKGGSLSDVISTALRIVFLHTYRPKKRPILWLDEPGKDLDSVRLPRFTRWLQMISHELGIQLIVITHEDEIISAADRIFRLVRGRQGVKVEIEDVKPDLEGYGFSHGA